MRHWDDQEVQQLEQFLARGTPVRVIARELKRSTGSVTRKIQRFKKNQLAPRPARRRALTATSKRKCLSCGRLFRSEGIGNRVCGHCKDNLRDMAHLEGVTK
ncbi:MAG: helix-turn-helix domain-containing protein [Pseudomonadota bacterium]